MNCLAWVLLLCLAASVSGVNSLEREFLCPICGTHWQQRIETSGNARALRLDLRQVGDVVDPPSLPQCTKCRFPLFSEGLIEQAGDPAKAPAFHRLRQFVMGVDFQMLAAKNPSYFALAQVQGMIGGKENPTPHRYIALSYLRASWQVEEREAACQRLLEKAREHYVSALADAASDLRLNRELALLCGEVERRLRRWDEAEKRFRDLDASGMLAGTPQAAIPALQLRLIARRDAAPRLLDGSDVAPDPILEKRDAEDKPLLNLQDPGATTTVSGGLELRPVPPASASPEGPLELPQK